MSSSSPVCSAKILPCLVDFISLGKHPRKKGHEKAKMRTIITGALILVFTAAAAVSQAASPASAKNGSKTPDPNRVICRTQSVLGTRLKTIRTCHTQAEWEQLRHDVRNTTDRVQNGKFWNCGIKPGMGC
ncbi:MAG TPA: hypothetical protein VFL92_12695 [Sphingomonas sp.]|nr:hypothetical protein [Sphingomonas sp.]